MKAKSISTKRQSISQPRSIFRGSRRGCIWSIFR